MSSRTSALATLVASLVLLLVTAALWTGSGARGVGMELPVTESGATDPGDAVDQAETVEPAGPTEELARAEAGALGTDFDAPGDPALPSPASIPLQDATRIEPSAQMDPPRAVRIPSAEVSMPIVATGVLDDGQMQLPEDPAQIGWYRFGPGPGEDRGSVVLGGHVDSVRFGVGPLARLSALQEGAAIIVTAADGAPIRYRVTSVQRISKAALPVDRLFNPDSRPRLVVVTCGGRYLPEAGGYEDNIVVIAQPV